MNWWSAADVKRSNNTSSLAADSENFRCQGGNPLTVCSNIFGGNPIMIFLFSPHFSIVKSHGWWLCFVTLKGEEYIIKRDTACELLSWLDETFLEAIRC